MNILELLLKEFDEEAVRTRKMLQRLPQDEWAYKPHGKSMALQNLAIHLAELPGWISMGLQTDELDFAKTPYTQPDLKSTSSIMEMFEKSVGEGRAALRSAKEEDLLPQWTLRNGEQVYSTMTKYELIRHAFSQTIHHRAQLGVYLRLLNIAIPGTYGPSADEPF